MGEDSTFADAVADFSVAYADQTEQDYGAMIKAVRDGRIPVRSKAL